MDTATAPAARTKVCLFCGTDKFPHTCTIHEVLPTNRVVIAEPCMVCGVTSYPHTCR